jgi:1,4-dihydroxy-2-naphthoate octaprenyltransferase
MSVTQVAWGGVICFVIASVLAVPLLWAGGWPILWVGVVSLLAGYAYTGGPFPLAYLGLGDLFVLIFFGWVSVCGVYYLQTGAVGWGPWIAGSQVGLLSTIMIAINNLRDRPTDIKVQKKTLAVRFGTSFARGEIFVLCFLPFLGGIFWFDLNLLWAAFLPLGVLPLACLLSYQISVTPPGPIYNQYLAHGALLHLIFGLLLSVGLWIG